MLIVFITVNTTHSEEQGQPFKQTGTTTIYLFRYQSCTWQCSGPFCQKKKNILVVTVQLAWFLFLKILFYNFVQSGHIPLFYFSLMIYFSCICRN